MEARKGGREVRGTKSAHRGINEFGMFQQQKTGLYSWDTVNGENMVANEVKDKNQSQIMYSVRCLRKKCKFYLGTVETHWKDLNKKWIYVFKR